MSENPGWPGVNNSMPQWNQTTGCKSWNADYVSLHGYMMLLNTPFYSP